jgi:hypothetical protein
MAYYEAYTKEDKRYVLKRIYEETEPPIAIQVERMGDKRGICTNRYLHGVLFKQISKRTGMLPDEVKAWMGIKYWLVEEVDAKNFHLNEDILENCNCYLIHGTVYVVEKTSKMTSKRFQECVMMVEIFLEEELDSDTGSNKDYIPEIFMNLIY